MRTELLDGYFIEQRNNNFSLKQKYSGIRKGKVCDCEKIISYHPTFLDAAERFLRLYSGSKNDDRVIAIDQYIKMIQAENEKAVAAVQESCMNHFFVYTPKAEPKSSDGLSIVDLIPVGRDNAIPRKSLVQLCVQSGLISPKLSEDYKDRKMRNLIEMARLDYTILNLQDGKGYYRVSKEDLQDLQKYIRQEENRAKATFRNLSMAKKLYEDYKTGRL